MSRTVKRWLIGGGLAVVLLIALGFGAILIYANFINDSPDALDTDDLAQALDATTTVPADDSVSDAATEPTTARSDPAASFTGTWALTSESVVRYRVDEVLFGVNTTAVGETNQVEGSVTLDDASVTAADFTVDVATMESDEGRRDRQFRGNIMETERFPNATFELTEPIDLGELPTAGQEVTASATGDLTMHGVTNRVTFDVTAQTRPNRVGVLGSIPIEFADYDIDNPSFSGITTEDHGTVEFVLVFQPA